MAKKMKTFFTVKATGSVVGVYNTKAEALIKAKQLKKLRPKDKSLIYVTSFKRKIK